VSGVFVALPGPAATGNPLGRDQGPGAALAAQITSGAARIHQLTEQLDQARMQIRTSTAQLDSATRQHDQAETAIQADQGLLHTQAVTAYMHGPSTYQGGASVDLTLGREYLKVATGNLTETTDRLRVLATNLRRSQSALTGARQASIDAVAQAQHARDQAIVVAADEQAQLDRIQRQAAAAQILVRSTQPIGSVALPQAAQGLPVNNGLVALVKAVAAVPVSTAPPAPPSTHTTTPTTTAAAGAGGVWLSLRQCESGNDYAANTGNGYYGAYQFSLSTWAGLGYPGQPDQAPAAMQDKAAAELQARSGWGQWPACAAALGLA